MCENSYWSIALLTVHNFISSQVWVIEKVLNFIYDNPDNSIVKFLKDTGDVSTVSKTVGKKFGLFNIKEAASEIDSLAFIDTKSVQKSIKKTI